MASPTEITVQQLSKLIGLPNCPALIDIRIDEDFDADPRFIPGARRRLHADLQTWLSHYAGQKAVIICHKGKKLSQGVAALMRAEGVEAETLEGGFVAWAEAGLPTVNPARLPAPDGKGRTLWVTRARPKVDRVACPWLIRRFVDPNAVFLFVSPSEVMDVADRFGAEPFDLEGAFWSHRGEECTFDTMLREFELDQPALWHLSVIVRGADTARPDLAPECAGLLAASLGLSRMYRDDLHQLDAAMGVYDAFYRWCRDATEEAHDWPMQSGGGK